MTDAPDELQDDAMPEPAALRLLRRLVTVLMAVMIVGVIAIVALLVIRFSSPPGPILPEDFSLPEGAVAEAVTYGHGRVIVLTEAQEILVFDATTGALVQRVALIP